MDDKVKYYLVSEEILTDAMLRTLHAKELLESKKVKSINLSCKYAGVSRSAFYKYKDKIHETIKSPNQIICIFLLLEDKTNTLSGVINEIGKAKANILTINQGIPLGGTARVSIYIESKNMTKSIDALITALLKKSGVLKVNLSGGGI